jgi:2-polyprenyl-3-methyl-5-hydroxy-6-metoxy-1,4-benzoquinol methylase
MNIKITTGWDDEYQAGRLGGEIMPDYALLYFYSHVPKGKVLDLGGGEGRNALFFAKKGYDVQLVDCSQTAIENCEKNSKEIDVAVDTKICSIQNFTIKPRCYNLIIASLVLQAFRKAESTKIISRMIQGIRPNGFLYISVLSTDDSGYENRKMNLNEVEKNTFYISDRDLYVHYFTNDELLSFFPDWKLIYYSEPRFLRTGEYSLKFPYQASIEYLGRKPF